MESPAKKTHIWKQRFLIAVLQAVILILAGVTIAVIINTCRHDGLPWMGYHPVAETLLDKEEGIRTISLEEAWNGYRKGSVQFIDAREPSDYSSAHLPGALNVPADKAGDHIKRIESVMLSKKDLVIYCSDPGCPLSNELASALAAHGIKDVKVMPEGWAGWYEAGFPYEGKE